MKFWVVAAVVTAATLVAIAAAYGVGGVAGMQAGIPGAAPIGQEPPRGPSGSAGGAGGEGGAGLVHGLYLHDGATVIGSFDVAGTAEAHCERGDVALGGGRLGSGSGLRAVGDGPVMGTAGALQPIGWRVECERTDLDRSPRSFAAYVVCRPG